MKTLAVIGIFMGFNAFGYGYYENSYDLGNTRYTYGHDYETGTTYNMNTYKSGNMVYGSGYDSKGNYVNCTSYRFGNSVQTTCY